MALSLKEKKIASSFRKKLEQLKCPYVEGVDDSWIIELVYRPGEPRIRLLQWLFAKFSPRLSEIMDPHYPVPDSKIDGRIQRLLIAASSMLLCCPEDADLIRGTCAVNKQTVFMEQLLDMVCLTDTTQDPITRSMHSPGHISGLTIEEQFHQDTYLMDSLLSAQTTIEGMFTTNPKILPPDILKHLGTLKQQHPEESGVPDLSELINDAEKLARGLQKHQDQMATLYAEYRSSDASRDSSSCTTATGSNAQQHRRVHSTVRVVLTDLRQILTGFSTCYDNELRPWCHRTAPKLSQLGPLCERVHGLLSHFSQMMDDYGEIQSSYSSISEDIENSVKKIAHQLKQPGEDNLDSKLFHECVQVLDESITRLDNSPNASFRSGITLSTIKSASSD